MGDAEVTQRKKSVTCDMITNLAYCIIYLVYMFSKYPDEFEIFKNTRPTVATWLRISLGGYFVHLMFNLALYAAIKPGNGRAFKKMGDCINLVLMGISIYSMVVVTSFPMSEASFVQMNQNTEKMMDFHEFCQVMMWIRGIAILLVAFFCCCFCSCFCILIAARGGQISEAFTQLKAKSARIPGVKNYLSDN